MSDLRSQINSLSPAEKAELLDTVWESLEADSASLTDAQRAELLEISERPTLAEMRERLHRRKPVDAELDTARLVAEERGTNCGANPSSTKDAV